MLAGTIVINIMIAIADITALIRIIAMALIFIIAIIMIIAMIDMAYTAFFYYITCCLILQKSLYLKQSRYFLDIINNSDTFFQYFFIKLL